MGKKLAKMSCFLIKYHIKYKYLHNRRESMALFLKQIKSRDMWNQVTGHVDPQNSKSHGTIIDNLSDYSEDKEKTYQETYGGIA